MCVFCEIVKGNIPSRKIYEDDETLVILDISQATYGHSLVIPKEHYDNILECPKEVVNKTFQTAQDISKLLLEKLHADGINVLSNINEAAGQTVMHTHIHLIPRYGKCETPNIEFKENKFDLDKILDEIKK